jgi:hypothetical protein
MRKLTLYLALLLAGCGIAGLYGALHDQISYTVSPDYFHAFKFPMFRIPESFHNRIGASMVGWAGAWWMGMIIGVPVLLAGLAIPGPKAYLRECLIAFGVVTATALVVGLGALVYASLTITEANLPDYSYPIGVKDKVAFARVGTMHNFGYTGGYLGILTAMAYLLVRAILLNRRDRKPRGGGADG